jgi:hypothetical protein
MFRPKSLLVLVTCLIIGTAPAQPQENLSVAALFDQLQSPDTTDGATRELLKRAADPEVRKYLATHLPGLIEKGPVKVQPWNNATRVAGEFRITEAVSALAKWIGAQTGTGLLTLPREVRLENEPAAKALAQIGDPSVPALADILRHGQSVNGGTRRTL